MNGPEEPGSLSAHNPSVSASRREFLRDASAAVLATGVYTSASARASDSPNERLRILCVGTANRAASNIDGVKGEELVGLCDVDSNYLDRAGSQFPDAKRYSDYREMIAGMSDKADAIVVATADHHHAPAAIRGMQSGLHCYCEKPLAHTVTEARMMANLAAEKGLVTQMGTQIHAGDNYRRVVEIIRAGVIGDVSRVTVWVGKGWGGGERPTEAQTAPPPDNLDWDLWLGPAPERPYAPGRYHPAQWRRWWDFGQGTLGDMGCHYMDLPFWALKLTAPTTIEAEGPPVHPETCPLGLTVNYKFPATDKHGAIDFTWHDGNQVPREVAGQRVPSSGVMFEGTEGAMFASYTNYRLFPSDKFRGFEPPPQTIPASIGHHAEWIAACKDGRPTTCNFQYSGNLTETVLLGNVAYRVGRPITWDADALKSPDCPEADQYLKKEYRNGWEVS